MTQTIKVKKYPAVNTYVNVECMNCDWTLHKSFPKVALGLTHQHVKSTGHSVRHAKFTGAIYKPAR